jgi:hypothetical protein
MSLKRKVEDQLLISCAVACLRVLAAVAVNVSLPENTSGASDEGGTFASSMMMMALWAGHWRGTTLIVFSVSWQSGCGNRAGLIFCSFCIKTKGKEENLNTCYFLSVLFPDEKYQKSSTNNAIHALRGLNLFLAASAANFFSLRSLRELFSCLAAGRLERLQRIERIERHRFVRFVRNSRLVRLSRHRSERSVIRCVAFAITAEIGAKGV